MQVGDTVLLTEGVPGERDRQLAGAREQSESGDCVVGLFQFEEQRLARGDSMEGVRTGGLPEVDLVQRAEAREMGEPIEVGVGDEAAHGEESRGRQAVGAIGRDHARCELVIVGGAAKSESSVKTNRTRPGASIPSSCSIRRPEDPRAGFATDRPILGYAPGNASMTERSENECEDWGQLQRCLEK